MTSSLAQNSTPSLRGSIYQIYIALEECFKLTENQSVYIETYGDVTVSNQYQLEIKQYQSDLTNTDQNIWKTLKNWLNKDFDHTQYQSLILITTQAYGKKCKFKSWNTSNLKDKQAILNTIRNNYLLRKKKDKKTEKLLEFVLEKTHQSKLNEIINKFIIIDSSPLDESYYNQIVQVHGKSVFDKNKEDYINSLVGYIIQPVKSNQEQWKITYEDFENKSVNLIEDYTRETVIFPSKYSSAEIEDSDVENYQEHNFVKKIKDIDYDKVINKAISDFINTNKTIMQELFKYEIDKHHYDAFEDELINKFSPTYSRYSRNTNFNNQIKDSKNFYDEIISSSSPKFRNFINTPIFFRNGILHTLLDDDEKSLQWKLEVEEE